MFLFAGAVEYGAKHAVTKTGTEDVFENLRLNLAFGTEKDRYGPDEVHNWSKYKGW
jgi:hypothetical protein